MLARGLSKMRLRVIRKEIMKISEVTRPAKAGKQLGYAITEIVNILYLKKNALCFLNSLIKVLTIDFDRRKKEGR